VADEYRGKLCRIHQERHDRTIELRNQYFPTLFAALVRMENIRSRISECEAEIKAHHSDVRDRNALTAELQKRLEKLREQLDSARAEVLRQRKTYNENVRAFDIMWSSFHDWQRVKDLDKRRRLYDKIRWLSTAELKVVDDNLQAKAVANAAAADRECKRKPLPLEDINTDWLTEYGEMDVELDLQKRELGREYQARGLHSAVRSEVDDASDIKEKKNGPGMRYFYGRKPTPRPWEKIPLHIGKGGMLIDNVVAGKCPSLRITKKGRSNIISITQQLGTKKQSLRLDYGVHVTREIPADAKLKQWSLIVRRDMILVPNASRKAITRERLRATVTAVVATAGMNKPKGTGLLTYDLSWTRRGEGIEVCRFVGTHVNESVILPMELIERRMRVKEVQQHVDLLCNALLTERGCTPQPKAKQGYEALLVYCRENPEDNGAANLLDTSTLGLYRARRIESKAIRTIESIYKTVAFRVCSLHETIVVDPIKLDKIKRYDTRDLLKVDPLPPKSREYLTACAPGKLQALLKGYGLDMITKKEFGDSEPPKAPRNTDLIMSYVRQAGRKTSRKASGAARD